MTGAPAGSCCWMLFCAKTFFVIITSVGMHVKTMSDQCASRQVQLVSYGPSTMLPQKQSNFHIRQARSFREEPFSVSLLALAVGCFHIYVHITPGSVYRLQTRSLITQPKDTMASLSCVSNAFTRNS